MANGWKRITRTTSVENLLQDFPWSVKFLINRKLPCLVCGEPSWGTLEELAREKRWSEDAIDTLIEEMNLYIQQEDKR
jgi:hypothetical protein